MKFAARVNEFLDKRESDLLEGALISVTKLVSDSIKVPEGDYRVLIKDCDICTLVPTSESNKQVYEVLRPTLAGFFNPEIHKRTITQTDSKVIEESADEVDEWDRMGPSKYMVLGGLGSAGQEKLSSKPIKRDLPTMEAARQWIRDNPEICAQNQYVGITEYRDGHPIGQ